MATSTIKKTSVFTLLLSEVSIPTTATEYTCDWGSYDAFEFVFKQYNNVRSSVLLPKSYFNNTTSGTRVQLFDPQGNSRYIYAYKGSDTSKISLIASSDASSSVYGVFVYGINF